MKLKYIPALLLVMNFNAIAGGIRCVVNNNGTFIGMDGTIWQVCLYGQTWENGECKGDAKNVSWYEAMNAAVVSNFAGESDWILPSEAFLRKSIHPRSCKHPNIPMSITEYFQGATVVNIDKHFWTGSKKSGNSARVTDKKYTFGYNTVFYDTQKSASDFDKSYPYIYAVFVRRAPEDDQKEFQSSLPYVQCNESCRQNRKVIQAKMDEAKVQEGEEWRRSLRQQIFGSASNTSTSSSDSASNSSTNTKSFSIRSESYNNAGRKTEGYWIKCGSGAETRVYRTAWDNNRAWYKTGFPNGYYLANGNVNINEVAELVCR